jgi:hypothetical protein
LMAHLVKHFNCMFVWRSAAFLRRVAIKLICLPLPHFGVSAMDIGHALSYRGTRSMLSR